MKNRDIKIGVFIIIFDVIMFPLFMNIDFFIKYFVEKYLIVDFIIGGVLIISFIINTIILIVIKRRIRVIFFIDMFLIHIIIIWITFISFNFKYNLNSIRLFVFPVIILIVYICFSVILRKRRKK
jgi:hypothetical protein